MNKKVLLISVIGLFIVIVLFIVIYALTRPTPTDDAITVVTDQDTGETIVFNENRQVETSGNPSVVILGVEPLLNSELVPIQISFIREQIGVFADERLDDQYRTVTIIPESYRDNRSGTITGLLRLGQTEETVPFTFTASNTGETRVVINSNNEAYGGVFDSGETDFGAD